MQTYHLFEWLKNSKFLSVQFFRSCKLTCMVLKICIHIISLKTFEPFPFSKDKMGVPIQVISYNLLINYTSAFSRMGSSEIGFLSAHNSRMQFQYGAEQEVLLPWYICNKSVLFFWSQVLDLPLEKLFICDDCVPRPEF